MVLENERNVNFITCSHVLLRDSLYVKLNKIYQRIPAHHTKIIAGDLNAKIGDLAIP
jgi:hypothetical protein